VSNQFKDVEKEFLELKRKFKQKKISEREFKDRLKTLRLRDQKGRCWTIGAQTGKWYFFDGQNWVSAKPPSLQDKKAICIYCGYENDLESKVCAFCGGKVEENELSELPKLTPELKNNNKITPPENNTPQFLKENVKLVLQDQAQEEEEEEEITYNLRSLNVFSHMIFTGWIGFFIGMIISVFMGVTNLFSGITNMFPAFLREFQGKLLGGLIYGGLGGVFGFAILAILGIIGVLFINMILSLVGGIRINLKKEK